MKNLDNKVIDKTEQINGIQAALEGDDPKVVAERIVNSYMNNIEHFQGIMNETITEANKAKEENWDQKVLAERGVRTLTNEERAFYNKAIEAQSFDHVDSLMPATIFENVFKDLEKEHPLLSRINFQTVGATTQWVLRKPGATVAYWGDVRDKIKEMVQDGFYTIDQGLNKLSGFIVIPKAMFELGPEWLHRYVTKFLYEVIADALEDSVVNGTGNKQPIGMIKDLDGAVIAGEYPDKAKIVLNDLSPKTIGKKILAPTTKGGKIRYTGVTLIVNPLDYATKFFDLGAKQRDDGTWTYDNFSVPGLEIIQCAAVPTNTLIAGNPKDYFMGIRNEQKIEISDEVRMIEDQRLYLVRQLANGRPLESDAFTIFDITNLGGATPVPAP